MTASPYTFTPDLPPVHGYGPGLAMTVTATGEHVGTVRLVRDGSPGRRWLIYDATGTKIGSTKIRADAPYLILRHARETATSATDR